MSVLTSQSLKLTQVASPQHQDLGHFNSGPALLAFCPRLVHGQPRFAPRPLTVLSRAVSGCGCPHICPTLMALRCPLHRTCFLGVTLGPAAGASPRKLASSRLPSVGQLATAHPSSAEPDGSVGAAHSGMNPGGGGHGVSQRPPSAQLMPFQLRGTFSGSCMCPVLGPLPRELPFSWELALGTRNHSNR